MVSASRTLGPLHFEDLEPKRFEDLTRQLVYDFKTWRRLEATGRSGSDDGFDARGYEIVLADRSLVSEAEEEDAAPLVGISDRLWLVQCKRERAIGPKKLLQYIEEIKLSDGEALHGIIFSAACDFSKAGRDLFATAASRWACRSGTSGVKRKLKTGFFERKTTGSSLPILASH